jgi:hypothetical protein
MRQMGVFIIFLILTNHASGKGYLKAKGYDATGEELLKVIWKTKIFP